MSTTSNNRSAGSRSRGQSSSAGRSRQTNSRGAGRGVHKSAPLRNRRNTKRRKKPTPNYKMIAIIGVILILVITGAVFAAKYFINREGAVNVGTEESETELKRDVTVNGVSITGMSHDQARDVVLKHVGWNMKVVYEDDGSPYELPNFMEAKVDAVLDEIYQGEPKESYTLDTGGLEEAIRSEVAAIAGLWDVQPQNGAIAGFDKTTGTFNYTAEKSGKLIDRETLAKDMEAALSSGQFSAVLTAKGVTVEPEITQAQAKELYKVIGTMSTTTTSNKDRNTNIQLAAGALDGLIIQPGGEFSFNQTTGNRTVEKGYKPAGAYVNGILVEEPGGGVCQVSSTLYNAVIFSGLNTTERHAHSYEPSYITPGEDAMVSYDGFAGPDMKFVNNSKDAIAIRAKFEQQKLTISIVGIPILEDGEKLYMKSEKTAVLPPPEPTYEENQALEPGVEKVVKQPVDGSRWSTNLVREKNGTVVSDEFFHRSTYRGKAATIQRNTSGVVIPESTEGMEPAESTTADVNEPGLPSAEMPTGPMGPGEPQGPGVETEPFETPPDMPLPQEPDPSQGMTDQPGGGIAPNPFS